MYKSATVANLSLSTGTISAMLVERHASIEDGGFIQQAPMVYFFGHKSPQENIPLYNLLVSKLAETVHERMESNRKGIYNSYIFMR